MFSKLMMCDDPNNDDEVNRLIDLYLLDFEESLLLDDIVAELDPKTCKRKRRYYPRNNSFSDTYWGKMLIDPLISDPKSRVGKKFRRRFRLPYPLFQQLVDICDELDVFNSKYITKIPTAARVLVCLRMLGRDSCADDMEELSNSLVSESTALYTFHKFLRGIVAKVYPVYVKTPLSDPNYLREVMGTYAMLGLPGATGSMDGTRIKWSMCPKGLKHLCTGKEGFPTLTFQVVVDHFRRIQYVSHYYLGANNDITVSANDFYSRSILAGCLQDIQYDIYDAAGNLIHAKGAYIITDGGYQDSIVFIDPDHSRMSRESVLWSEWVESVRKDVECTFGILKSRFRFLRNGVPYHDPRMIENAFKTASCLHNMILIFDGRASVEDKEWERVNWEELEPDGTDYETDEESVFSESDISDVARDTDLQQLTMPTQEHQQLQSSHNVEVTFTTSMRKRYLKDKLQTSFRVQWLKGKLSWPKNFSKVQKLAVGGSLTRAAFEIKQAIMVKPSGLMAFNVNTGAFTKPIGKGLFHSLSLKRDELVAYYVGTWRTATEYDRMCENDPMRRRYALKSSEYGLVLDCYDCYCQGLCVASWANSPKDCFNTATGAAAVANARIVANFQSKTISIRVGVNYPHSYRSPANFWIPSNTEILVDYGDIFASENFK